MTLCEDVAGKRKPDPSAPLFRLYSSNAVSVLLKKEIRKASLLPKRGTLNSSACQTWVQIAEKTVSSCQLKRNER